MLSNEKRVRTPPLSIPVEGLELHRPQPRYVRLLCPKCRSRNLKLIEIWENTITWAVTDGWMDRANGSLEPTGPLHVEATCCDCKHDWKPRNAAQIDNVLEELPDLEQE